MLSETADPETTSDERQLRPGALLLRDVSKRFRRYAYRNPSIKASTLGWITGRRNNFVEFDAVRNLSFHVPSGQMMTIIGRNGAGKSTLLRLLAGILQPDSGTIDAGGHMVPFLDLGAGFVPDLTGRQNAILYGLFLGLSRQRIQDELGSIVEFSGIRDFFDTPVRHYSSGMLLRLGFAVAAHVDPDILLLDEVLAVGDDEFQAKCLARLERFRADGKTIIAVTHSLRRVLEMCDRAVLLNDGEMAAYGPPRGVLRQYEQLQASQS